MPFAGTGNSVILGMMKGEVAASHDAPPDGWWLYLSSTTTVLPQNSKCFSKRNYGKITEVLSERRAFPLEEHPLLLLLKEMSPSNR